MILSVSRRTDIPAYYAEWFFRRLEQGYVCVRNPMNAHQVSRINLDPDIVDAIVFWSKNPKPMLNQLDRLKDYKYYFQYTINAYDKDFEPKVPPIDERITTFTSLADKIGKQCVIWRYDPIIFTEKYTPEYHLSQFEKIATKLKGSTEKVVISFVDVYASKNKKNLQEQKYYELNSEEINKFAKHLAEIASDNEMIVATCAEAIDLTFCGIEHNSCIDQSLIEKIVGYPLKVNKDGQRGECRCVKCEEIGSYDTCLHGCKYCYANYREAVVNENCRYYDVDSPLLCDTINPVSDKVTDRPVKSLRAKGTFGYEQMSLFD